MGMLGEFREFIARGSVVDLAVGVVIGAAFGKIVTAFVDGIVMPIVGVALGGVSVSDWKWVLKPETIDAAGKKVAEVAVRYGSFIQTLIDFVIIAFVLFLAIKGINRLKKPSTPAPDAPPAPPPREEVLLTEIRDLLKNR